MKRTQFAAIDVEELRKLGDLADWLEAGVTAARGAGHETLGLKLGMVELLVEALRTAGLPEAEELVWG